MLEYQKSRIHERSRLRAKGATDEEIRAVESAQELPFKPAFENGKRRPREGEDPAGATGLLAYRRP